MMNKQFETYIDNYFDSFADNKIKEAMIYSMDGGKRFRPRIIFSILKGMGINEERGYAAALALELIQTYSLIHDDLPAMDNDDLRRGKPTSHKAFGEDIAILTGDALLTHSFGAVADSEYDAQTKVNIISTLSRYAGMDGMILGQLYDVTTVPTEVDKERLFEIQDNKTAGLFKIACLIPMYIRGENNFNFYETLGTKLGVIFQNQDDLFDVIKSEEEMGKSLSDLINKKPCALNIYSVDELKQLIDDEFKDLEDFLKDATFDTTYFMDIMNALRNR